MRAGATGPVPGGNEAGRAPLQSCRSASPRPLGPGRPEPPPRPTPRNRPGSAPGWAQGPQGWPARLLPRRSPAPARSCFPLGRGQGSERPEAPPALLAPLTHLVARRSHMARARGPAATAWPPEPLPGGQDAAGGAEARKPRSWAGAARYSGRAGAPCSRRLGARAVTRRGGGAGTLAPSCVQPQTYSKFPRSCRRLKIVTCASPPGGRGCFSLCSEEAFRRLPFSV